MLSTLAYQDHIAKLGKLLGCDVILGEGYPGMMYVEFGYVEGPIIRTQSEVKCLT